MNKKGFTLIELIAVVVIMAIIALIATPNIVNMMDKGKKEDYVADAKEIITKATYMYKQEKYRTDASIFLGGTTIKLADIKGIDDYTDPYGFTYDKEQSTVKFEEPPTGSLGERTVTINLISINKDSNDCYQIDSVYKNSLNANSVKQGTWDGIKCELNNS